MSNELPRAYAYKLAPEMNSGKRATLAALHSEWQRTLPLAFEWFWQPFLRGGQFPHKPARSGPKSTFPATGLVTSQKDLMVVAIEGQARSWASNLARRIARSVMQDAVLAGDPALRRELLWINSMRAWLVPYPQQVKLLEAQPARPTPFARSRRQLRALCVRWYAATSLCTACPIHCSCPCR